MAETKEYRYGDDSLSDMQLETIECPICGSRECTLAFTARDFRYGDCDIRFNIVRCSLCNFKFVNPRPVESCIDRFYKKDFHKPGESFAYNILRPFTNFIRDKIIRTLVLYKKGGRVLDIGCGSGLLLSALSEAGFDVYGVEPSIQAAPYFPPKITNRVYNKRLELCAFDDNYFDLVILAQSLEHIHNLKSLFKEIKRVTRRGGIVWISVPNDEFFESKLFGPYYYNLEVPRHLYFFTKSSLWRLLVNNGFSDIRFIKNSFFASICTPASWYYGICYFLKDKNISDNGLLKKIFFLPLVLIRQLFRLLFIYEDQNLEFICKIA